MEQEMKSKGMMARKTRTNAGRRRGELILLFL